MTKKQLRLLLLMILLALLFLSCKKEDKPLYNYYEIKTKKATEPTTNTTTYQQVYAGNHPHDINHTDGVSYWFVVWQVKKTGGQVNGFVKFEHEGFSFSEFYKGNGKGNFIISFTEISETTYKLNK